MTNPSTLREAIENIPLPKVEGVNFEPKHLRLTVSTFLPPQTLDAILDAVIAALPNEKEALDVASDQDERSDFMIAKHAYLEAVGQVRAILQSAKGGTE